MSLVTPLSSTASRMQRGEEDTPQAGDLLDDSAYHGDQHQPSQIEQGNEDYAHHGAQRLLQSSPPHQDDSTALHDPFRVLHELDASIEEHYQKKIKNLEERHRLELQEKEKMMREKLHSAKEQTALWKRRCQTMLREVKKYLPEGGRLGLSWIEEELKATSFGEASPSSRSRSSSDGDEMNEVVAHDVDQRFQDRQPRRSTRAYEEADEEEDEPDAPDHSRLAGVSRDTEVRRLQRIVKKQGLLISKWKKVLSSCKIRGTTSGVRTPTSCTTALTSSRNILVSKSSSMAPASETVHFDLQELITCSTTQAPTITPMTDIGDQVGVAATPCSPPSAGRSKRLMSPSSKEQDHVEEKSSTDRNNEERTTRSSAEQEDDVNNKVPVSSSPYGGSASTCLSLSPSSIAPTPSQEHKVDEDDGSCRVQRTCAAQLHQMQQVDTSSCLIAETSSFIAPPTPYSARTPSSPSNALHHRGSAIAVGGVAPTAATNREKPTKEQLAFESRSRLARAFSSDLVSRSRASLEGYAQIFQNRQGRNVMADALFSGAQGAGDYTASARTSTTSLQVAVPGALNTSTMSGVLGEGGTSRQNPREEEASTTSQTKRFSTNLVVPTHPPEEDGSTNLEVLYSTLPTHEEVGCQHDLLLSRQTSGSLAGLELQPLQCAMSSPTTATPAPPPEGSNSRGLLSKASSPTFSSSSAAPGDKDVDHAHALDSMPIAQASPSITDLKPPRTASRLPHPPGAASDSLLNDQELLLLPYCPSSPSAQKSGHKKQQDHLGCSSSSLAPGPSNNNKTTLTLESCATTSKDDVSLRKTAQQVEHMHMSSSSKSNDKNQHTALMLGGPTHSLPQRDEFQLHQNTTTRHSNPTGTILENKDNINMTTTSPVVNIQLVSPVVQVLSPTESSQEHHQMQEVVLNRPTTSRGLLEPQLLQPSPQTSSSSSLTLPGAQHEVRSSAGGLFSQGNNDNMSAQETLTSSTANDNSSRVASTSSRKEFVQIVHAISPIPGVRNTSRKSSLSNSISQSQNFTPKITHSGPDYQHHFLGQRVGYEVAIEPPKHAEKGAYSELENQAGSSSLGLSGGTTASSMRQRQKYAREETDALRAALLASRRN
ncbi:unnamed protein product [Amoebophrya sp. A25]|nr:unnamed protein product [Amoebophrya sp. A25]|eukprot:GSA25T00007030001.1